ncbi:MAG: Eco57I restriction-modification methylase domain-containing protein [Rugosibacter sp.]
MSGQVAFTLRGRNPDVLTCIANLSNDEVFTPPEFANRMLDTLAEAWAADHDGANLWADKTVRFLDPCTKSGVFLREITTRLTQGLADEIPNLEARVNYILTRQVFGIGITQLTSLLARRSLYCSKHAKGEHSIAKGFTSDDGNIWFKRLEHTWADDKCKYCGASRKTLDRGQALETHAYAFIHTDNIKTRMTELFGGNMQFDVIIGNPPYQLSGGDTSDTPIYHRFVQQAMTLEPRYLVMVTPSRWFTGGKGLDDYRESMIADRHLRMLIDFPNSMETFPGVEIKGGVSYFLWDREYEGDCEFTTVSGGQAMSQATRDLRDGRGVVIRDNRASSIIEKVTRQGGPWLSERVSPQTPFGLYTNFTDWHPKKRAGDIQLFKRGLEDAWMNPENVTARRDWIPKIKVIMSYAYNGGDALPHQITGRPIVIPGNSAVTQTYMVAGVFDTQEEAENYAEYIRTRLVRFLIRQRKISQHNRPDTFAFVPDLPTNRKWTDADLYQKFEITEEEQAYIESLIKPMATDAAIEDEG